MSDAETYPEIRESVRRLCADFPGSYWQAKDRDRAYPTEFVRTLTEAGFLSVLMSPATSSMSTPCSRTIRTASPAPACPTKRSSPR